MIDLEKFKAQLKEEQVIDEYLSMAIEILEDEAGLSEDEIAVEELKTDYNTFSYYGNYSYAVLKRTDFEEYVKDICRQFTQVLPDKFDEYFNLDTMIKDILENEWFVVLRQAQDFIDAQGQEVSKVEEIKIFGDYVYLKLY